EPGSGAAASARRPETGGDAAAHGFCYCPGSRKRKRSSGAFCCCHPGSETDEDEQEGDGQQRLLNTPWRKTLKSTSKYIYQTLFLNGENSDIKICALEEWSLHKMYLCQSGYFPSMFSGSWKESSMNIIELETPDQNIDIEALQVAFGSLYRDDVLIKPSRVIAILAAACMLQLDGLIQQCGETMKETISVKTRMWLLHIGRDLWTGFCKEKNVEHFKELSINVMKQLIGSSNLFVMQVEMDVYTALKNWMFLDFHGGAYIISDLASTRIIEQDSLVPSEWLSSVYKQQWLAMLRAEQDSE
ncbi:hypothetical protein EI555_004790, partial [Monodon monoceros]